VCKVTFDQFNLFHSIADITVKLSSGCFRRSQQSEIRNSQLTGLHEYATLCELSGTRMMLVAHTTTQL
jgi:hypothetical protein